MFSLRYTLNICVVIGLLVMIIVAVIIATKKRMEKFTTDGEWIMRHVDPAFGGGGLLIPIVRGGGGTSQEYVPAPRRSAYTFAPKSSTTSAPKSSTTSAPKSSTTSAPTTPTVTAKVPDTTQKTVQPPTESQTQCLQRINNYLQPRNLSVGILVKNEVQGVVDRLTDSEKAALNITEFPSPDINGKTLSENYFNGLKEHSYLGIYLWCATRGNEMQGLTWTDGAKETNLMNRAVEILNYVWTECQKNHSSAPEWLAVKAKWPVALVFFDGQRSDSYAICINVGVAVKATVIGFQEKIETDWVGLEKNVSYLIAHELAHIAHLNHNEVWRTVTLFMCNVIAKKYTVPIFSNRCSLYGICDKQLCPACEWQFETDKLSTTCEISDVKAALDGGGKQIWHIY